MGGATGPWEQLHSTPEQSRLLGAGYGNLQFQIHFAVHALIDLRNEEHLRDGHLTVNGQLRPATTKSKTDSLKAMQHTAGPVSGGRNVATEAATHKAQR